MDKKTWEKQKLENDGKYIYLRYNKKYDYEQYIGWFNAKTETLYNNRYGTFYIDYKKLMLFGESAEEPI
jgi:hypothetical protein